MLSNHFVRAALALLFVVGVSLDLYMGITQGSSFSVELAWSVATGVSAVPPVAIRAAMALGVLLVAIAVFSRLGQTLPASAP